MYIVSHIGKDSEQFLPLIIPSVLNGISMEGENNALSIFYDCLKMIFRYVPQCISKYQNMIFDTFQQVITHHHMLASEIIMLVRWINMMSTETYHP